MAAATDKGYRQAWASWDPSPASHPWLTTEHLHAMREQSVAAWAEARRIAEARQGAGSPRYAFVGNLANYLFMRAVPLRKRGLGIAMYLHPLDTFALSSPGWELFDGEVEGGDFDLSALARLGIELPHVDDVHVVAAEPAPFPVGSDGAALDPREAVEWATGHAFPHEEAAVRYPAYLCYLPLLEALQPYSALLATQSPYLGYLSGRPYLTAQGGGDLWFECSRGDRLGELQRLAFGRSAAILASNPWTFAHARRYGFDNVIYLPFMVDDEDYAPGPASARADWIERVGGSFFVLCASRLDDQYKGSALALDGFRAFAAREPEARLVLLGWGEDLEAHQQQLREWGLGDVVLILPMAGKRLLVEYFRSADVLLDQFSLGAYGATALEGLACATPVVMRLELEQYDALVPAGAPPVVNATTSNEVAAALERLAASPEERARIGRAGRDWFVAAHGSSTWADRHADILVATAAGHRFSGGPALSRRLSRAERDYHRHGLEQAPPFPT